MQEGPFQGALFELTLDIPSDYPLSSPVIKFAIPVTHPNVDEKTGEVNVPWDATKPSPILQALKDVQALLVYPLCRSDTVPVKNIEAQTLWATDRPTFDNGAYAEARQSWLSKLNPSESSGMLCDMIFPAKKVSREAQHKLFEAMALSEIDAKYESQPVTTFHEAGLDPKLNERRDLENKLQVQKNEEEQKVLTARVTSTLRSLSDLRNPREVVQVWLEEELARLFVAEITSKPEQEAGMAALPSTVQQLLEERNQLRPRTSEQCFEMLVAEAEQEIKQHGDEIEDCMNKYELLYSRFKKVQEIKDYPGKVAGKY